MKWNPEFIEFVNREQMGVLLAERGEIAFGNIDAAAAAAAGRLAGVDAFVFGKILMVDESFPEDEVSDPLTVSERVGGSGTVSATVWEHSRFGHVEVRATWSVIEAHSGKVLGGDELRDRREDLVRWITFDGDDRAVPGYLITQQTPGGERPLLSAQDMVLAAIEEMSSTMASALLQMFE